jgi:ABC-2 type transport system permease protein
MRSLLRADFAVMLKNRRSTYISMALPIVILLTTNSATSTAHFGGSLFIIGLAITYGIAGTSMLGYGLTIARDREAGVFQRLRVTPAPTWTIMTSRLIIQTLANLIIALVGLVVGTQLHHISPAPYQYVLVLLVSIFAGAVFLSLGQAIAGLIKSAETVNAVSRVLYIALVLLGTLSQSGALGSFWKSASRWFPIGAVMRLFAATIDIHSWSNQDTLAVLTCIGYIVVFAGIGIRWFQWESR